MKGHSALNSIQIRNLGVIETASVEFSSGLTVLTGETGAGKTMILSALNLILGGKFDNNLIRNGTDRALVSGEFQIPKSLISVLDELGAEVDENEVVINRVLSDSGKSKLSIGGVPVPAAKVAEIGEELVEIHGQSSSNRLLKSSVQREILDNYGKLERQVGEYRTLLDSYRKLERELNDLKASLKNRDVEISRLREVVDNQNKAKVRKDEFFEISSEISKLESGQAISEAINLSLSVLASDEDAPTSLISQAHKSLKSIEKIDKEIAAIVEAIRDSIETLNFAVSDLERYRDSINADPAYFDQLQSRKAELSSLAKRYGQTEDKNLSLNQFVEMASEAKAKIEQLSGGEGALADLTSKLDDLFLNLKKAAINLNEARAKASTQLCLDVQQELIDLALPNAELQINISTNDPDNPKNYGNDGIDEVEFLFRSHPSAKFASIGKGASGGELSRIMLALEVVIAKLSPVGTYIFDEVDSGVGGKAAMEVGKKLAKIAKSAQVIVITHLAQVAVWADSHYVVEKSESGDVTESNVFKVEKDRRKMEIARLLSGQEESKSANEHASELLDIVASSVIS